MTLKAFERDRSPDWEELEGLVVAAGGRVQKLGPARLRRLGSLYRRAAADLAFTRRRFPGDPLVTRLEALVGQARFLVYETEAQRGTLLGFLVRGYWRAVAERPAFLAAAAVLLLVPALVTGAWAVADPPAAEGLVPGAFSDAIEPGPEGTDIGVGPAGEAAFSAQVLTNNIRVTFAAFAGGVFAGIGTVVVLVLNGLLVGAVGGLLIGGGNAEYFAELVAAHGVIELSCIIVAAAAGLRMGWALIEPGNRSRLAALAAEGRVAVLVVLGTAPWLVVAGLIEGFVSRQGRQATPMLIVGVLVGALYWGLVWWRGRPERRRGAAPTAAPAPSR